MITIGYFILAFLFVCVCGNFRILAWGDAMSDTPKRYIIKIRRLKKGTYGRTQYAFSTKLKAVIFASGYQAAFRDLGQNDLYVSVWEHNAISGTNYKLTVDTDGLKEIAERTC